MSDCTVRAICKATGKDWGEVYLSLCGTYILALSGHVVCVQDGVIYDSWNSENEIPLYYWVKETEE